MNASVTDFQGIGDGKQISLVAFQMDQQAYALPIEPIVQIIEIVTITPLPQVTYLIEGVINVHGVIVPVISLRRYLGLADTPLHLHTPIILVRNGERTVGLIVDKVLDVLHLPRRQVAHPTEIMPEGLESPPLLQGLARLKDNRLLLLLNLDALFKTSPLCGLLDQIPTLLEGLVPPSENFSQPSQPQIHHGESEKHESTSAMET